MPSRFLKDKREQKNALLEERKKAYQALIYDTLLTSMDDPQSKQKFYNLMVLLTMYGSKKIVKAFYAFNRESTNSSKHMKKNYRTSTGRDRHKRETLR